MPDPFSIISMVASMADAKANREAAKDNARRMELRREYASQMRDQRDRRTITDYNVAARGDQIDRDTALDAEQAKEYQGQQAAGFLEPRAGLGLGGIAGGMRGRTMEGVGDAATTNPLTGGSAFADALTQQHRDLMLETGQDADDMSLIMAGDRRAAEDREALSRVAASQQGEAPRIGSMQQDAAVGRSDTGARGRKRKMDIGVKEQAIDTTYEPWIEGHQGVAKGSMADAAKLGAMISDSFKPTTFPTGRAGLSYAKGHDPMLGAKGGGGYTRGAR